MIFKYKSIDNAGKEIEGTVDAVSVDVAISSLQRRGLVVVSIKGAEETSILEMKISLFDHIPLKDVVVFSRQLATLFEAQVSALRAFRLLTAESVNVGLRKRLAEITDDLQSGVQISKALEKHPDIFSSFYVSMVRSGEESGKLNEIFLYLADYLERQYEVSNKVRNALIYPAFVVVTFVSVMVLMLTMVIPKISQIITESGQEVPIYTTIVLGVSKFFVDYGAFLVAALVVCGFFLYRYSRTEEGKESFSQFKIDLPLFGQLYRKLYLSRIADNYSTMLASGIPVLRAIEITSAVVDNRVYERILLMAATKVRGGAALSEAMGGNTEIPGIMIGMLKVGEESGELGKILRTLSRYYAREVSDTVDTIVSLIEPAMIVLLGAGVGFLLAAVLIPIYSLTANA